MKRHLLMLISCSIFAALTTVRIEASPTVMIRSPQQDSTFFAPATIVIETIDAIPEEYPVIKVEFFNNRVKIGEDTTEVAVGGRRIHSFVWSNVPVGDYLIEAKATIRSSGQLIVTGPYNRIRVSVKAADANNRRYLMLTKGWNLISLPLQPTATDLLQVLSSINEKYTVVHAYDGKKYETYVPATVNNSLAKMEAARGYWVHMKEAKTLTLTGIIPTPNINLKHGWNLTGYNSLKAMPVAQALNSIDGSHQSVYAFDPASNGYVGYSPSGMTALSLIEPDKGYWIFANKDITWTLSQSYTRLRVKVTKPTEGNKFPVSKNIQVAVHVPDPINKVQTFANGKLIGELTAPFSNLCGSNLYCFDFVPTDKEDVTITAKVISTAGDGQLIETSAPVNIVIAGQ
jgi:hypothetical protein